VSSFEASVGWDCEDGGPAALVDTDQHYISHYSEADNMNIIQSGPQKCSPPSVLHVSL
jgi:hypothetical protein